jgi:uracil phosphoribosyltransferase
MIHELSQNNSILNHFLAEIRDSNVQKDSMRFRKNMERISEIMAYEVSKTLIYEPTDITTPLGIKRLNKTRENVVIASILRAGLSMHDGVLNFFDKAENAYISAYRESEDGGEVKVKIEYMAAPEIEGKTLILVDPMLATGTSLLLSLKALLRNGKPSKIHILSAIASQKGIDHVSAQLGESVELWVGDIDEKLNDKSYIIPGLGDAGDLAFGIKK